MITKLKNNAIATMICLVAIFISRPCEAKDPKVRLGGDNTEMNDSAKPRFLSIDAAANFPDLANNKENILRDLKLAKDAGFTDVVVNVRPVTGDVLFKTDLADQVKWLGAWQPSGYGKFERTATWDWLQAFIDAGHSLGLKVHAFADIFVGGYITNLGSEGMLFRDSDKREWATSLLSAKGEIVNTLDLKTTGAMYLNPAHEGVQNFILEILEDIAAYQDLDGIFLDRGRYDGLNSDFSDYSRKKFEEYLGYSVTKFPEDVVTPEMLDYNELPSKLPVHFKKWVEYRAKTIHDFMEEARIRVKTVNPDISFGVYVGAWYESYYNMGVNWASPDYDTFSDYPKWATKNYQNYGYADLMDIILIGAYASPSKIFGTTEMTVQGYCSLATHKIKGDAMVIGGPDVGNGDWATSSPEIVNQAIIQSVDAAMIACDGYFLFDMIHLKNRNKWEYVKQGINAAIGKSCKKQIK